MRFRIHVKRIETGETHWENYDKNVDDAQEWAEETIAKFNDTLREHESARELLEVEVLAPDTLPEHQWDKTNLVTESDGGDSYKCVVCGVTARRRTITGPIRLDHKYRRSKVYHRCDTALRHLKKHGHPKG